MTKTLIDEIIIIGNNLSNSGLNEFVNREGVLCIGDGKSDVTLDLINEKLQGVTFADNLRIDLSTLFRTVVYARFCISAYFTGDR